MPTYRSITTSIISQHGIYSLPEYPPPAAPHDPFSTLPTLCDQERALVSVYIPTYPSSQFWIRYSIAPPYPPKALYYFKLFLKGTCVVSWGCGEDDGYEGRTIFGLYDSGDCWMGDSGIERRVFCFGRGAKPGDSTAVDPSDVMEIKIYRAKGRMRIKPRIDEFRHVIGGSENGKGPKSNTIGSISLVSAGLLARKDPQRFYKYALLDPLDKPFATFHYHNRTWRQLAALGVIPRVKGVIAVQTENQLLERSSSPVGSHNTVSSNNTISSSSSSSNTLEHVISRPDEITPVPTKWAIFAPKFTRSDSTENSPKKPVKSELPKAQKEKTRSAVTAPSLLSLSPPHNPTVTQAKFASLIRRARTPSPPKRGFGSRIPTPSPRKHALTRRTSPPSPPKRTATRIPTPSPTKSDRVLGRSLSPPADDMPSNPTGGPVPKVPRSGSMSLLMNAIDSAMNRRRRLMLDGAIENIKSDGANSLTEPSEAQVSAPGREDDNKSIREGDDPLSGDGEADEGEIELLKALEDAPQESSGPEFAEGSLGTIEKSEDSTSGRSGTKADEENQRNVSDASSTRRRRWAIWGGLKQRKSDEEGGDAVEESSEGSHTLNRTE